MKILQGSIVKSMAGHDKDSYYIITGIDGEYVYIANGKERKLQKPKRKSIKHIAPTKTIINLTEISNKKIKKLLNEFSNNTEQSELTE